MSWPTPGATSWGVPRADRDGHGGWLPTACAGSPAPTAQSRSAARPGTTARARGSSPAGSHRSGPRAHAQTRDRISASPAEAGRHHDQRRHFVIGDSIQQHELERIEENDINDLQALQIRFVSEVLFHLSSARTLFGGESPAQPCTLGLDFAQGLQPSAGRCWCLCTASRSARRPRRPRSARSLLECNVEDAGYARGRFAADQGFVRGSDETRK